MEETNLDTITEKIPSASIQIQKYIGKNINWIGVFYEDLYGNMFATFNRGVGENYNKAVDFVSF